MTVVKIGITPAYAGKSLFTPFAKSWCKDHPRLCGEKLSGKMPLSSTTRITPAYAGKSPFDRIRQTGNKDHPRLCGEKQRTLTSGFVQMGSPPPMRGKVLDRQIFPIIRRITPAYAGKRYLPLEKSCKTWDHPRLCGEKSRFLFFSGSNLGSPPPMRGKGTMLKQSGNW